MPRYPSSDLACRTRWGILLGLLCVLTATTAPHARAQTAATRAPNALTRLEVEAGWIRLFDGQTLFGWKANSNVNWSVKEGTIVGDTGESGLLNTTTEFADYELKCDFRLEKGGNSGIFLRTLFKPKDPSTDCYELNICDAHPAFKTGSFVGLKQPVKEVSGEGKWMTYHVIAQGPKVDVKLDGELILSYVETRTTAYKRGFIGLQKNSGKAEFRNIYLKPLTTKELFNGKDLKGWRLVPGGKSLFTVKDGTIHVKDGRGFLETESTWGDFVLQADIKTNGTHLNSGIFFRAMPGTEKDPSNGYECQVHNAYKDNDRTKPLDFGTGAIYRLSPARKVIPEDKSWFTTTLIAHGPHIAVWVDGTQVTDWTDERAPNENPRKGLRTKAGHFSLQGHDPTTDLNFRNFRVAEFPQ